MFIPSGYLIPLLGFFPKREVKRRRTFITDVLHSVRLSNNSSLNRQLPFVEEILTGLDMLLKPHSHCATDRETEAQSTSGNRIRVARLANGRCKA